MKNLLFGVLVGLVLCPASGYASDTELNRFFFGGKKDPPTETRKFSTVTVTNKTGVTILFKFDEPNPPGANDRRTVAQFLDDGYTTLANNTSFGFNTRTTGRITMVALPIGPPASIPPPTSRRVAAAAADVPQPVSLGSTTVNVAEDSEYSFEILRNPNGSLFFSETTSANTGRLAKYNAKKKKGKR